MTSSSGHRGVTVKQIAARASRPSGAFKGSQESATGTEATRSTPKVSSKLRSNLAFLTAHQVKEIKVSELDNFLPGIDCAKLSVKVDQEEDGPVYSLETALTRPTYPEITAVSLVRKVSKVLSN